MGRVGGALVAPARRAAAVGALGASLAFGGASAARRSVQVLPHAVYLDNRTRAAQVQLANTDPVAVDVTVELRFGYPDADSTGDLYIRLVDAPSESQPSAAAWTTVYPRHIVVPAGAKQVVRLLAQPPADLPNGEYWARMLITTRPALDSLSTAPIVTTITAVTYRNGPVRTGVAIGSLRAGVVRDSLVVRCALEREGNAAWLGTSSVRLLDGTGRVRAQWDAPAAVYYRMERRMAFPLDVPAGSYRVRLALSTTRTDIPTRVVLPAPPVDATTELEVSPRRP